ncbi:MAG: hypothetical protein U1F83_17005 [Verrucomicrobiota bacterium]
MLNHIDLSVSYERKVNWQTMRLRQVHLAIGLVLVIIAIVIVGAFNSAKWVNVPNDTPWIGPDCRAIEQQRPHFSWNNGVSHEVRWLGTNGVRYDMDEVARVCERFLKSEHVGIDSTRPRFQESTAWKTIVSLSPTIVLTVTADIAKSQKGWLLGTNHSTREFGAPVASPGYDCGTVVFYNADVFWFSPDLGLGPKPVTFGSDGLAEIAFPGGTLELQIEGEICKITRK